MLTKDSSFDLIDMAFQFVPVDFEHPVCCVIDFFRSFQHKFEFLVLYIFFYQKISKIAKEKQLLRF